MYKTHLNWVKKYVIKRANVPKQLTKNKGLIRGKRYGLKVGTKEHKLKKIMFNYKNYINYGFLLINDNKSGPPTDAF